MIKARRNSKYNPSQHFNGNGRQRSTSPLLPHAQKELPPAVAQKKGWTRPPEIQYQPRRPIEHPYDTNVGFLGPGNPPLPHENSEYAPRVIEYPVGVNVNYIPRQGFGLHPFSLLRGLAEECPEIRLNIELIKRQLKALDFTFEAAKEGDKTDYTPQIKILKDFWQSPDGQQADFDTWLGMILEEILVIDALTLWPARTRDGTVFGIEIIQGDTIAPMVDYRGRVPRPPAIAYLQVLRGIPRGWYTRNALLYRPMRPRSTSPYGSSPTEDFLGVVDVALRRLRYQVAYYTEGNIPEALIGAPAEWDGDQIKDFQDAFDALLVGSTKNQRRMHLFPTGVGGLNVHEFKRDAAFLGTPADEWQMKVACWAFGNNPSEFGITGGAGLGGAGYTASMENAQYRSMIGPMTTFLGNLFTAITQNLLGYKALKWKWLGMEPVEDKLVQAQVDQIYLAAGVYDKVFVAKRLGINPNDALSLDASPPPPSLAGVMTIFDQKATAMGAGPATLVVKQGENNEPIAKGSGILRDDPLFTEKAKAANTLKAAILAFMEGLRGSILAEAEKHRQETNVGRVKPLLSAEYIAQKRVELNRVLMPILTDLANGAINTFAEGIDSKGLVVGSIMDAYAEGAQWAKSESERLANQIIPLATDSSGLKGIGAVIINWQNTTGATVEELGASLAPIMDKNDYRAKTVAISAITAAFAIGAGIAFRNAGVAEAKFSPPAHIGCRCRTDITLIDGLWEQVWVSDRVEAACHSNITTPWGAKKGCGDLHNTILSGQHAGKRLGEVNTNG